MSSPPQRPGLGGSRPQRSSGSLLGYLGGKLLSAAVFLLVLYFLGVIKLPNWGGAKPPQAGVEAAAEAPAGPPGKNVEQVTTASIHKQQLALAKVNQKQLIATYEQLKRTLDEWEKELLAWEQEGPGLLKNEAGKKIATDPAQVSRFRGLTRVTRPNRDQLTTARQAADDLIRPIRESLANPEDASSPDNSLTSSLEKLATDALHARDSYRQSTNAVRAMLAQVKDNAPSTKSLEEALATLDQEDDAQRVAAIDAEEKKAKDEAAKKVAAEKVKLAEAEAEAEANRIKDQVAKEKQKAEIAAARAAEEMAATKKQAEQDQVRFQNLQEEKRQGDLKAGSVWKGTLLSSGGTTFEGTMKIESRVKDEVKGSLVYQTPGGGERGQFTFKGKVTGTSLRLIPIAGAADTDIHQCVYNQASKTISGQGAYRSFNLKLWDGKDE
jgi:septal ring factor EnvC (AmiA/AmiB activator)